MVIPQSSAFMTLSFSSFKAFISSLVMSLTSISLRSISGFFFLKTKAGSEFPMTRGDAVFPTVETLGVVKAEATAKEATNTRRERKIIMLVFTIIDSANLALGRKMCRLLAVVPYGFYLTYTKLRHNDSRCLVFWSMEVFTV